MVYYNGLPILEISSGLEHLPSPCLLPLACLGKIAMSAIMQLGERLIRPHSTPLNPTPVFTFLQKITPGASKAYS